MARRKHALEGVAAAARERGAPDVLVVPADVSDPEQSRRAAEETVAHFGKCVPPCLCLWPCLGERQLLQKRFLEKHISLV